MPKPLITLSKTQARKIILHAQGLNNPCQSTDDVIQQLGYVQIDTLSVAERAHHHVIQTRNPQYNPSELNDLMLNKTVFEYWSHAASVLPMADYRFSLVRKQEYANGKFHWFSHDKEMADYVLNRIKTEGPLQSKDFQHVRDTPGAWYDWKPAKIALEQLFMEGRLMVKERNNFHKVYDLTERVIPEHCDVSVPTPSEFCNYLTRTTLKAQGLATIAEIGYLRKNIRKELQHAINNLLETNEIIEVKVHGLNGIYYALNASFNSTNCTETNIINPFDNLIIQRKRTQELFDFDYQIECYVPEKKRKFGYYCLPILYGDQFIGKFDPKADRKTQLFTIKSFWFEDGFTPDEKFIHDFSVKLKAFIAFCGCSKLKILKYRNNPVLKAIQNQVNSHF